MMQPEQPARGPWLCKPCHKLFSSWEALMKHKDQKRREDNGDHIHCKFCGQDFKTSMGEIRHIQQEHPQEQNLDCPGCGHGPFKRLGALMSHIESGECIRINTSVLDELREKKLEFPRKLEELTQQSIKGNHMSCMPSTYAATSYSGWEVDEEAIPFNHKVDFPTLSSTAGIRSQPSKNAASTVSKQDDDDMGSWGKKEAAPAAQRPPPIQGSGVRTVFQAMDPDDPTSPAFNSSRYYCAISESYNCPKRFCGKTFKLANGLVAHLRSPAHGDRSYRCPYCLRIFKSLTAITQHAESSGTRCRIRDTDDYDSFLDQVTAGLVDIERTRNEDGTIMYKTSKQAKARFRGKEADENGEPKPQQIKW